jgi:hypothetical protein
MYPIDVPSLVRRGTHGSRATDRTLPTRRSRWFRVARLFRSHTRPL